MSSKYSEEEVKIRPAKKEDIRIVYQMIKDLAIFHDMAHKVRMTCEELERDGFDCQPPLYHCLVAERQTAGRQLIGHAVYVPFYLASQGRTLLMDELYVKPEERGRGVGERLFRAVVKEVERLSCHRMNFVVEKDNSARSFYQRHGAEDLSDIEGWHYFVIKNEHIRKINGYQ
ncbi:thialysine N-epsilon-acetyltransferase isoform X6 [Plutella xylostella]|uniref:thialysine N-epsilon-acetyltransferase isoform X6 n=1 Tax=Plutella xylostella TaxID=51655 RepID=UPI002032CE39|nr:thialysine N-epsilon-acetyltransferase isoform X6 [Plutella xylostella]